MHRPATLSLFLFVNSAWAQQAPLTEAPAAPRVEVKGPDADARRRADPLGRIVVGRDELQRFGDTSLGAVLARQPGVTVDRGEVRMRGLGAGYTQVLIDGQPAPAGFTIGALAPELVERIEIQRSAQADAGAQAIAGSINIVLRKAGAAPRRSGKLGAGTGRDGSSQVASLQSTGRAGAASYGLVVALDAGVTREHPVVDERTADAQGAVRRRFIGEDKEKVRKLSVAPRVDVKLDGGDTLGWQGLADFTRRDYGSRQLETTLQGPSTASPDTNWRGLYDTWLVKSDVNWSHRAGDGRLTARASLQATGRTGDYHFHGIDGSGAPWLNIAVDSGAYERSLGTNGKYVMPLAAGHDAAIGWDMTAVRLGESRHQRNTGLAGPDSTPLYALDQDYDATVARLAWFAQDEWAVSDRLQAYIGLRWEGLDTRTAGRDMARAKTASRVWSPVLQTVWKLPGGAKPPQLRVGLARTYKAPQPRDLVPRRYTVNNDNGPASPDYQGNPLLRPELSWGLDAALEAPLRSGRGEDGMVSVALYARRIRDVTQLRLWQERGVWVSSPANVGDASVRGVEMDARVPLASPAPGWPAVELRANLTRNWSRVTGLPAPDNRLASQTPLSANLGVDLRHAAGMKAGLNAGANLRVVAGARSRTAQSLVVESGVARELEAYAAWPASGGQWRLTAANLLQSARRDARLYDDGAFASARRTATPRHASLRLQYEATIR